MVQLVKKLQYKCLVKLRIKLMQILVLVVQEFLDLMEELRPVLADRLCLSLFNRQQLRASGFELRESGAVEMKDDTRKTVLTTWQERKKVERVHTFLGEKAPLGLVPYLQAQMLSRHLRGDLNAYPPWFWK